MYEVYISNELKENTYIKLIKYLASKSDAFMLVTYRHDIENKEYKIPDRNIFENESDYIQFIRSIENMEIERKKNLIIFNESTEIFLSKLKPYLIKRRNTPTEWPSSKVIFYDNTCVDIDIYKVCNESIPILYEAKGLFKWRYPYFPDDLSFFKDGYCWFYIVAHEGYAFMYLDDETESENLKKLGLNFDLGKWGKDKKSLCYEAYKL